MKKGWFSVPLLAALALPQPALADAWCGGTILSAWVDADGGVYIEGSWRMAHTQICHTGSEWKTIRLDVCAAWLAKVDSAASLDTPITVYYAYENDCATIATMGSAPAPTYIMLR